MLKGVPNRKYSKAGRWEGREIQTLTLAQRRERAGASADVGHSLGQGKIQK